jgi:hypothetical protein
MTPRLLITLALLLSAPLTTGCASGDFGRVRREAKSDDMHRWIGNEATGSVGLTASQFQLTENERLLRDSAYPLIEPPRSRPAWKTVFGEYKPIKAPWHQDVVFDRTAYGKLLIDEPHRSHTSRYAVLMDDVRNDLVQFDPFYTAAERVLELDKKRAAAMNILAELSPAERADSIARMEENALIVQWVQQCLRRRVASYRWALERLVIHAPDNVAANADMLITELATRVDHPPVLIQGAIGRATGRAIVSKG